MAREFKWSFLKCNGNISLSKNKQSWMKGILKEGMRESERCVWKEVRVVEGGRKEGKWERGGRERDVWLKF